MRPVGGKGPATKIRSAAANSAALGGPDVVGEIASFAQAFHGSDVSV